MMMVMMIMPLIRVMMFMNTINDDYYDIWWSKLLPLLWQWWQSRLCWWWILDDVANFNWVVINWLRFDEWWWCHLLLYDRLNANSCWYSLHAIHEYDLSSITRSIHSISIIIDLSPMIDLWLIAAIDHGSHDHYSQCFWFTSCNSTWISKLTRLMEVPANGGKQLCGDLVQGIIRLNEGRWG